MDTEILLETIGKTDLRRGIKSKIDPNFRVHDAPEVYVPPGLEMRFELIATGVQSVFISAKGATGKSVFAQYASSQLAAPLWLTDEDLALGGSALENKLLRYAHEVEIEREISNLRRPIVIVDALDEAEVRISAQSWQEFKDSLVKFARLGVQFVICGRDNATLDVITEFENADLSFVAYELLPLTESQRVELVDTLCERMGCQHLSSDAYKNARDEILGNLLFKVGGETDENFAGYAPVLQAVATELSAEKNLGAQTSRAKFSDLRGVIKTIGTVAEQILAREQAKFRKSLGDDFANYPDLYSPREQVECLLYCAELIPESPKPVGVAERHLEDYLEKRSKQTEDHPFLSTSSSEIWSSSVFEGYCLALGDEVVPARREFMQSASKNPFFSLFWSYLGLTESDSFGVAALHASLLSFAISVEVTPEKRQEVTHQQAKGKIEKSGERLAYRGEVNFGQYVAEPIVLIDTVDIKGSEEGFLTFRGPLQFLDVDVPEGYIILDPEDRAPFLGPDLTVSADVLEIASREVKLSSNAGSPLLTVIANEIVYPLPKISSVPDDAAEHIRLMPRLNYWNRMEARDLPYPWGSFFFSYYFDLPERDRANADASIYKFFRLIEGLRILSTKYVLGGMTTAGFSSKAGLNRGKPQTNEIFDLLQTFGLLRFEGEMVQAGEGNSMPLFATPLTRPRNSATPFAKLTPAQQEEWKRFLMKYSFVVAKGSRK